MTAPRETDPTRRFDDRVEAYRRYRPVYPTDVFLRLREETGLESSWVVADVGSGTGILTKVFLDNGNVVFAVEPNPQMRAAAEKDLGKALNFRSVAGSAEATTLATASVDMVAAGQAFHWFDVEKTASEFRRVLRPGGWVALLWNTRRTQASPFMEAYERLLIERAVDYERVDHRRIDAVALARFFAEYRRFAFEFSDRLDYAHLEGRLMSASYVPAVTHPDHPAFVEGLREIFAGHARGGAVDVEYETELYVGRL